MAVTAEVAGNTVTIKMQGRFDFSIHQDFVKVYKEYSRGEKSFVVDLSGADYMDSSAMGMLLQLRDYGVKGSKVELVKANDSIKEILRIANFDKLFDID